MGWNFILQIARFQEVIAVTRQNNRSRIEQYMQEHPDGRYERIRFLYFDLPYWKRFWKRGSRGAMLYYWLWQRGVVSFIQQQELHFDIAHNLNFHNDWTPSYLWKLGKPMVWGPIGHHPLAPAQYLKGYGMAYRIKARLAWLVKRYFWSYSSGLQRTIQHAQHIFCMNHAVPSRLRLTEGSYSIMPSVASQDFGYEPPSSKQPGFSLITAGRLTPLKGYDLSLRAFAQFLESLEPDARRDCCLHVVGSGPEEKRYRWLAKSLNIDQYVTFINWIERPELMTLFRRCSVFLFPSHEGAGMVVAEALSFGLPVVCLDNAGPGAFINADCGYAIPEGPYSHTVRGLSVALQQLYRDPLLRIQMGRAARQHFEDHFHWDRRGETLRIIYQSLLAHEDICLSPA